MMYKLTLERNGREVLCTGIAPNPMTVMSRFAEGLAEARWRGGEEWRDVVRAGEKLWKAEDK